MASRRTRPKSKLLADQSRETIQRGGGTTADAVPHQLANAGGRESAHSERRKDLQHCGGGRVRLGGGVQPSLQEGDGCSSRDLARGSAVNDLGSGNSNIWSNRRASSRSPSNSTSP